ncbi:MAG: UDP-N-acetylglucosamine 1-carboxyvinyltransferase [Clostridia bacterium]|nr:UDP-N-acetylglucosamine 1-carboxyvinyltransferase [Clostridia bacterium]
MNTEEKLVINGGRRLKGEVNIHGSKNAAVALVAAALLVEGPVTIENLPGITDVEILLNVIEELGGEVVRLSHDMVRIDCSRITKSKADNYDLSRIRASYYLVGSLLGRKGSAEVIFPGGCNFGPRPIDQHKKGFEALGAQFEATGGFITAKARKLTGCQVYFDKISVGATINVLLAATLADGLTTIENAAREPHIVDVANFLNMMGADIKGAGTNVIRIRGVDKLAGGKTYSVVPDMIEAGTFMIAAAVTRGTITVKNIIPEHMESLTVKLNETGSVDIEEGDDWIRVKGIRRPKGVLVQTMEYPGFPTDLQPQMVSLLSIADGHGTITEGVWDNRFQYVEQLLQMGANIRVEGRTALITGVGKLIGAPIRAMDLRAAASLILAGLAAEGTTTVYNLEYLDRGYEGFIQKLAELGADIKRIGV